MKKYLLLMLLFCLSSGHLIAQPNYKGVAWMMKEKFKIDPEIAMKYATMQQEKADDEGHKSSLKYTDVPIVTSSNIDAEVHAAINPLDSHNILASPIRQTMTSINTPIYYTKNFGSTWNKASFNPMPSVPGAYPIGGGDPVLAFDENGRAYFSWLELYLKNIIFLQGCTILC